MNETGDGVVGDQFGDLLRRLRPFRPEPVRRPGQGAEKRAGGDGRVGGPQRATLDAAGDQAADAALVAIALGDDRRAKARRQGVDLEVRRRSLDLVDKAEDVRHRHVVKTVGQRPEAVAARQRQRLEQAIERAVLAEEQDLVLAAEVVVEVARRQVGGDGDLAHAGGGEAPGAEHPRRGVHDVEAAPAGAD